MKSNIEKMKVAIQKLENDSNGMATTKKYYHPKEAWREKEVDIYYVFDILSLLLIHFVSFSIKYHHILHKFYDNDKNERMLECSRKKH